jgi:hypothetical protein
MANYLNTMNSTWCPHRTCTHTHTPIRGCAVRADKVLGARTEHSALVQFVQDVQRLLPSRRPQRQAARGRDGRLFATNKIWHEPCGTERLRSLREEIDHLNAALTLNCKGITLPEIAVPARKVELVDDR